MRKEDEDSEICRNGFLVALLAEAFSGCGCFYQAMKGEAAPAPPSPAMVQKTQELPAPVKEMVAAPAQQEAATVALKDIHFDFDRYSIRREDAEILKQGLGWFQENPGTHVRIEGNCDERGTVEYNLVLGQKRADSAKIYLTTLGVETKMLETISYGKERPVDPGHNEESWAKNRRDHFVSLK
ncbi:MAG: peptidoglycan-associated lipoprotein Pal [Syntrophorhabdales bacterium]